LDGLWFLVSQLHLQPVARRGDGHVPVSEAPHQVEGFARRLLEREAQRVRRHRLLDGLAHLRRRAEVPVRRHQASQRLMRPPEIVRLDEELEAPLAIGEVCEDGA
jgi:hypothetical protein